MATGNMHQKFGEVWPVSSEICERAENQKSNQSWVLFTYLLLSVSQVAIFLRTQRLSFMSICCQELRQTVWRSRPVMTTVVTSSRCPRVTSRITWCRPRVVDTPICSCAHLNPSTQPGLCWPSTGIEAEVLQPQLYFIFFIYAAYQRPSSPSSDGRYAGKILQKNQETAFPIATSLNLWDPVFGSSVWILLNFAMFTGLFNGTGVVLSVWTLLDWKKSVDDQLQHPVCYNLLTVIAVWHAMIPWYNSETELLISS